jgi:poly(A) polymerase
MVLRDNIFGTPVEDALRRDFTINALAYNIADFSVIDVTNGIADLKQRIIRPIGDPAVRFTEDPVRMIRAVRFAAALDFTIERETWETLCTNASTVTRAAPARLYEEMLKLFLLGSARPIFRLMDKSGLLAALIPWLDRWLHEHTGASVIIHATLERIDTLVREGMAPSPALLLAALFGPSLEERAIMVHRTGVPHQQALNALYNTFFEELCKTVTVPAKIGSRLRAILVMQPSLHKVPPRRPQGIVGRQNFDDALTYMRMMTEITGENIPARNWWTAFMNGQPPETIAVPAGVEPPPKRKRRRRKRKRRPAEIQD